MHAPRLNIETMPSARRTTRRISPAHEKQWFRERDIPLALYRTRRAWKLPIMPTNLSVAAFWKSRFLSARARV
jgi:hypothetical protein